VGVGVSCSADRNIKGKITRQGIFLEQLETDPARFLPDIEIAQDKAIPMDLNRPMDQIRAELSKYPIETPLLLTGNIVVARDIAHARLKEDLDRGIPLPDYMKDHIIYYAGPAKTPAGYPSGSFGPTTGARMDPYLPLFQKHGACFVTLAKGNRSDSVTESCRTYGGFYLGSIGGPGAHLGRDCITRVEAIAYPELGMEAVFMITVKNFPAFILVDDKGNNFFKRFSTL
jgi:fumarate hydratase class I